MSTVLKRVVKKILFLTRSLAPGGAERQLVELAKGLHRKGYSIFVSTFYPEGALEKEIREAGVPLKILRKRSRWDVFPFLARLVRLLINEKPDVIHGFLPIGPGQGSFCFRWRLSKRGRSIQIYRVY